MEKTIRPEKRLIEIERLTEREKISKNILKAIEKLVNIDYCGAEEWKLIDRIGKEIDHLIV